MLKQVPNSSIVTTTSDNIGERNMEQNNANLLDGENLEEELGACQPFLRDTEMENGRHKVFNFQMSK